MYMRSMLRREQVINIIRTRYPRRGVPRNIIKCLRRNAVDRERNKEKGLEGKSFLLGLVEHNFDREYLKSKILISSYQTLHSWLQGRPKDPGRKAIVFTGWIFSRFYYRN